MKTIMWECTRCSTQDRAARVGPIEGDFLPTGWVDITKLTELPDSTLCKTCVNDFWAWLNTRRTFKSPAVLGT